MALLGCVKPVTNLHLFIVEGESQDDRSSILKHLLLANHVQYGESIVLGQIYVQSVPGIIPRALQ